MGINNAVACENWPKEFSEYILLAYTDHHINGQVEAIKKNIPDNSASAIASARPHITIANFLAKDGMEPTLCRWMQMIAGSFPMFPVTLDKIAGIPPHTIYLNVKDKFPFEKLAQQFGTVNDFIKSSGCPAVMMTAKPYLVIATGLTENSYNSTMKRYAQNLFHETFMLEEFVLLKRQTLYDKCTTVQIFRLNPIAADLVGDAA